MPGVANSSVAFTQNAARTVARNAPATSLSIGGGSGRSNFVTIDGGENESGTGSLRIRNMSVEAIQEFQVNRNGFNAEYGFTTGTALNVITKSGTNDLHGNAYLFRPASVSSNNWRATWRWKRPISFIAACICPGPSRAITAKAALAPRIIRNALTARSMCALGLANERCASSSSS
jgi:hypothetical protein